MMIAFIAVFLGEFVQILIVSTLPLGLNWEKTKWYKNDDLMEF